MNALLSSNPNDSLLLRPNLTHRKPLCINPIDGFEIDSRGFRCCRELLNRYILYCPSAVGITGSNNCHDNVMESTIFNLWNEHLSRSVE